MKNRAFLRELCRPDSLIAHPFPSDGFDCASNGYAIVMLRGATLAPVPSAPPVARILSQVEGEPRRVNFAALKAWTLAEGLTKPCIDCCGSAKCNHCSEGRCPACGGKGTTPNQSLATLFEAPLDRCLLGRYLQHLTVIVRVGIVGDFKTPMSVETESGAWRVLVMPMVPTGNSKITATFSEVCP